MAIQITDDGGVGLIHIGTEADWQQFAAENKDALIEEYGSLGLARWHAKLSVLTIGGGAAPLFLVRLDA